MKNALFPLFFLVSALSLSAQPNDVPVLSAAEAVQIALANNYDIQLARADAEIAHLNNTKGNAGMLPNVALVAGDNATLNGLQIQNLADGRLIEAYGVFSNNINASVQLEWTLFDGRRMYITKNRLNEIEALGQINLQAAVQQTTAEVLLRYYDIVRSQQQERALAEVIALNEERLRIAEARLAAGMAAQTDALQARIDLNQRKADLLAQQTATLVAKRELNRLLARDPGTSFTVDEGLQPAYNPDREALLQKIQTQNPALLSLQKSADVAALSVREAQTLGKPRIVGLSQLGGARTDNGAGFLLNNSSMGLTVGAQLNLPLYTGGNIRRQVEVAKVQAQQSATRLDAQRLALSAALDDQLAYYQTSRQALALEEENVVNARENLKVSTERFRLGQTNALETQTAQNSLEQALLRRNLALYNLKVGELQLRLLAGEL
ncbi:MAG: TolC family protein [Saprospiraceae bacterium]|nr:TolC family protein [Saprospiraceae bacterium]